MNLLVYQGNLLRGIENCLGAAQSVVQVRWKTLDNSFSNIFSLFQLKSMKEVTKKVAHGKSSLSFYALICFICFTCQLLQ